jgi:hypothetical protein
MLRRFVCNKWPQYTIWTPQRQAIKFKDGVFETEDAEVVSFIYSEAMSNLFPRFISEVEIEGPAHGDVPQLEGQVSATQIFYCAECEKGFKNQFAYDQHMRMSRIHNQTEVSHGTENDQGANPYAVGD